MEGSVVGSCMLMCMESEGLWKAVRWVVHFDVQIQVF